MKPNKYNMRCIVGLIAIAFVIALSISNSGAMYLPDASIEVSSGVYNNPQDGVCVVGLKFDGTLDVNTAIDNYKDCITYATPGMLLLGKTACNGGAGNDGYKHSYSEAGGQGNPPQICLDGSGNPVSRANLDNTNAMCFSKGGTALTAASPNGKCVAYGWLYMNVKPGETIPYRSTITPAGYKGRTSTDDLGFCYTRMRMTSATYTSSATCPSYHNSSTLAPAEWLPCLSSTSGCQTQASYDAGLGWTWDSTNSRCLHDYGVKGIVNSAMTNADGTTFAAAGSSVDLTTITTQGECLSKGGSWDNWLPKDAGRTTKTNADAGYTGMPAGATIVKLDALTAVKDGGGNYYSGTGSVCLKCHSDQSRGYMERYKPGFVETPHKKAGDMSGPWQTHFMAVSSDWGLKGVQCTMCHSTARPANDDLIQVTPAGLTGAGNPVAATGHNKTEYGTYVTDVCFHCHGKFPSTDAASVIPVSAGDFALTQKGLAPIANQFLNSPHARYTGSTSAKVDIGNSTNYDSGFTSFICRTGLTTVSAPSGVTWNGTNCPAAGHTWTTPPGATANGCYYNSSSCGAAGLTWNTTFDANMYPVNNGGVCSGIGMGSIVTTVYRSGVVEKIPNLDSTTNPACTNYGNGTATSGASAYWVRDGERNIGANPETTDQGSCMTCHDVHYDFDSTLPGAEPVRRECTTCHVNPGTSATGAPQVTTTTFSHPTGVGTPLEHIIDHPYSACETCHMPYSSETGSRMHLWRINTNSSYSVMGTTGATQAATADHDGYTNAAWVDLDRSCGQCHGSAGSAHLFSKPVLSTLASGMHAGPAPTTDCATCHAVSQNGLPPIVGGQNHHPFSCDSCHDRGGVSPTPDAAFCNGCHSSKQQALINHPNKPALNTPDCGGCHSAGGFIPTAALACNGCHGGSAGPGSVSGRAPFLSAKKLQKILKAGMHRNVAPVASMTVTVIGMTATVTDTSTDFDGNIATIVIDWGDKAKTSIAEGDVVGHTYTKKGKKTITLTVTDSRGVKSTVKKSITVS